MIDNNYDKEEYERERQERIAYIESIERQSEDDFNESKESSEYVYTEDSGKSKQVLLGLLVTGTIGIAGYTGFNYLQDNTNQPPKTMVMGAELSKVEASTPVSQEKETTPVVQAPIEEKPELIASVAPLPIVVPKVIAQESIVEPTPSSIPKREIKTDTLNELSETVSSVIESSKPKIEKIEEKIPEKEPEVEKIAIVKETVKIEQPKRAKTRVVVVRKGDTLASIAERFYGNPMEFKRIIRANRDVRSSSTMLHLGQRLIVPRIEKEENRRMVIVRRGDTLASIAKKFYGNSMEFQRLIDANYQIKSASSMLSLGQKVYVPR